LAWTYSQLYSASSTLASRLSAFGLQKGTSIAFISENCAEWALFCWACVRLGCPLVPMNPAVLSTGNGEELRHMLQVTSPGVLVTQKEEMGKKLEASAPEEMKQNEEKTDFIGWISLQDLYPKVPETTPFPTRSTKKSFSDTVIIGFTSGTVSLPKACPQSISNIQITSAVARDGGIKPGHRTLQQAPAYHALATLLCLSYWSNGGTIIYPSATFDIIASLAAIQKEKCTAMAAVPAVIKAYTMVPNVADMLESVEMVRLAGAPVFPEIIRLCRDVLRIKEVGVSWGMTENPAPLSAILQEGVVLKNDEFFPVGTPAPGMKIKVCAAGSRIPLKRGEEGELHACGQQVIPGYLDADNEIFYEDRDGRWIMTGDMASVGTDGQVRILGRYKDIIIRGGANIAPASIEQRLNGIPGVDSQVVGMPDEMAGEVPVAINLLHGPAAKNPKATLGKLQELALKELGPKRAPTMYLDLKQDLQMEMFPMTASGKVKKTMLRKKVQEFLDQKSVENINTARETTEDVLIELWSQVSGLSTDNINKLTDVLTFVDSITIMRFSGSVRKRLMKDITVTEVSEYSTIQEQARLLDSRDSITVQLGQKPKGAPAAADMVFCEGNEVIANHIRELALPLLSKLSLNWDQDVEDVIPVPDTLSIYLRRSRPQTWNQRIIFIAHNTSHDELINAWKAILIHHPLMHALAAKHSDSEQQFFLVMRDNDSWWNCALLQNLTVPTPEDLRSTFVDEWADPDTTPLVRLAICRIESNPQDTGIILVWNHAVLDNIAANLFFEDFITAVEKKLSLEDIASAPGHTPFKVYAEKYHLHKSGSAAKEIIDWHVNRLTGISSLKTALWPKQKAPGWFKGTDAGWKNADGRPGDSSLRQPLDPERERFGLDGLTRTAKAPGLVALREQHGIPPYVVLKAAVVLFNIHRTGGSTAIFANLEAARYWPFVADWAAGKEQELPNPLNVAGPMFEVVINRIDVADKSEAALSFLKRIQQNQMELSANSHVPLFELLKALPPEDAEVVREATDRQIWNWPAGIQAQAQAASSGATEKQPGLEKLTRAAYDDVGLAWTCGLWDQETFYLNASYDDCQLGKKDAFEALGEVLSAASWL
ncbi:hypothetical protein B0O99DRAFT_483605, partial [Bisporella sp. PMI_857]